ncbi:MAG: type II secretion system protein GspM [Candidatus Thiodiazotropha lotti]|uniref:General secretion pathway protein GspM n=1 Tax=Candidatus Thiodiazotropha endoloripes TaxID=1818881 RepID=A0A1E2UN19_9GAMM|nr:type II secretion system protein GspM [Candidatus Thiodiazotropha endoloripes]MCG7899258.1 type II secretion system protein GspM [Candidatus Thiodiazotropha weberae]MCG7991355.1 type II secretion system protein GspM [Candidatus Thiodiazotropha lotti]MCG7902865.1 type II secretion system protein GspM [Candidatus Thiodiazotropha weberae]MCG8001067.1 type II secretion system protein GspM [Candidatus Thiodiazotropha lotti]MCW4183010.1 type II secretion system protein GspM [Candidatus Thiodiazot
MTPPVWSNRQCNLVLLGSFLLMLLVLLTLYLSWQGLMSRYQEVAEDARHRTAHYLRVAERKTTARSELGSAKLTALIKQNYLTAEAPGIAYAELQQQIKEIIGSAGGVALSTQLVQEPQSEQESAEKIIVRVRMQGDSYSLQKLVQAIEQRNPLLFFERLTIAAPAKSKSDKAEQLDIRFDVYGYFWKETS